MANHDNGQSIYNLFTVAAVHMASGIDDTAVPQHGNQRGFTTEISVWVPLPGSDNVDMVWVGTEVWGVPTVSCPARSCMLVIPTSSLGVATTIQPSPYTTTRVLTFLGPATAVATVDCSLIT